MNKKRLFGVAPYLFGLIVFCALNCLAKAPDVAISTVVGPGDNGYPKIAHRAPGLYRFHFSPKNGWKFIDKSGSFSVLATNSFGEHNGGLEGQEVEKEKDLFTPAPVDYKYLPDENNEAEYSGWIFVFKGFPGSFMVKFKGQMTPDGKGKKGEKRIEEWRLEAKSPSPTCDEMTITPKKAAIIWGRKTKGGPISQTFTVASTSEDFDPKETKWIVPLEMKTEARYDLFPKNLKGDSLTITSKDFRNVERHVISATNESGEGANRKVCKVSAELFIIDVNLEVKGSGENFEELLGVKVNTSIALGVTALVNDAGLGQGGKAVVSFPGFLEVFVKKNNGAIRPATPADMSWPAPGMKKYWVKGGGKNVGDAVISYLAFEDRITFKSGFGGGGGDDDDDDGVYVSLSADPAEILEPGASATVTASLSAAQEEDVTVGIGVSGTAGEEDYTIDGYEIVIPAGALEAHMYATSIDDELVEGDETIILDITSVSGGDVVEDGRQYAIVTIIDDDDDGGGGDDDDDDEKPTISFAVDTSEIPEKGGVATFTASLSKEADEAVSMTVTLSGTAGSDDYSGGGGGLSIPAGATEASFTVTATDDTLVEGNENIVAEISDVAGAEDPGTIQASTTIIDDDDEKPVIITKLDLEIESRDRMFHGTLKVPMDITSLSFKVGGAAGNFRNYQLLPADGSTYIYANETDIYSVSEGKAEDEGNLPRAIIEQKVVIIKDPNFRDIYHLYGIMDNLGDMQISVVANYEKYSFNHTLTSESEFKEIIDYANEWVNDEYFDTFNPGGPVVAAADLPIPGNRNVALRGVMGWLKNRGLVAKALISYFKANVNIPISLIKGVFCGVKQGVTDDVTGVVGIAKFLWSPYRRGSEFYNAIKHIKLADVGRMIDNGLASFMNDADTSVQWKLGQSDWSDDIASRAYISGFVFGYVCEQIAVMIIGAGVVAKVGHVVKGIMLTCKAGRYVLHGVRAVGRFRAAFAKFATMGITKAGYKAGELTKITKLIKKLKNLRVPNSTKTVAEILGDRYVSWSGKIKYARKFINGRWDDVGKELYETLANVTQKFGKKISDKMSDKAVNGFVKSFERLFFPNSLKHRYDDLVEVFTHNGVFDKASYNAAMEHLANKADNLAFPQLKVTGFQKRYPKAYRIQDGTAFVHGSKPPELVIDYVKRTGKIPEFKFGLETDIPRGNYIGVVDVADEKSARRLSQIDTDWSDCEYKFELDVSGEDVIVPYSAQKNDPLLMNKLEPLAKDWSVDTITKQVYPGGGPQFLTENARVIKIWRKNASGNYIQMIWP